MNLELKRDTFTDKSTIGKLYVNGFDFCETLEDVDRKLEEGGTKIKDRTCIQRGTYKVVIDFSTRFQIRMPHVLNVPQFTGIRIHSGNVATDTEGCILVGQIRGVDFVGDSRLAFAALFQELDSAFLADEKIELIIT
jgi:hypothetical protein